MSPAVTLVTYKLCSYCEVFLDVQERAADVPAKICGNTGAYIFLSMLTMWLDLKFVHQIY